MGNVLQGPSGPPFTPAALAAGLADPAAKVDWSGRAGIAKRSLQQKFGQVVDLLDFLTDAQVADVRAYGYALDCKAAIAAAVATFSVFGGCLLLPPGGIMVDGTGATVASPVVCAQLTIPNVHVRGHGTSTVVKMVGINTAQLNAQPAEGAGADIFTVFNWQGVKGGSIEQVSFLGPHVVGTDAALTNLRPRCKAISVFNSQDVHVRNCHGVGIAGNLVNFRGNSGVPETSTFGCSTSGCYGESCAENCFNYMGGTYYCDFSNNISYKSGYHGFETACQGGKADGNVLVAFRRSGLSIVGRYALYSNNIIDDRGNGLGAGQTFGVSFQWNAADQTFDASYNTVKGNSIRVSTAGGWGFTCADKTIGNTIEGNYVEVASGHGIYLNPTSGSTGCDDYHIVGNRVRVADTATYYGLFAGSKTRRSLVQGNVLDGGVRGIHLSYTLAGGSPDYTTGSADTCCSDLTIVQNRMINQSQDPFFLQGVRIVFERNYAEPGSGVARLGTVQYLTASRFVGNDLNNAADTTKKLSLSAGADRNPSGVNPNEMGSNFGGGFDLTTTVAFAGDTAKTNAQATAMSNITVAGADVGDRVVLSFDVDMLGLGHVARVSAANTVRWHLFNLTGSSVTPPAANVTARVYKGRSA